jgi:signal peptidase I
MSCSTGSTMTTVSSPKPRPADPTRALAAFAFYREDESSAWIEVNGWSMTPLVRPGDEVFVEFGTRAPAFGEIVVYRQGDLMIVHRLVWRQSSGSEQLLITRGDGMPLFDPPVPSSNVLGVVRSCRRPGSTSNIGVAASGRPARAAGSISVASGFLLTLVERLPRVIREPLRPIARALVLSISHGLLRAAARAEKVIG